MNGILLNFVSFFAGILLHFVGFFQVFYLILWFSFQTWGEMESRLGGDAPDANREEKFQKCECSPQKDSDLSPCNREFLSQEKSWNLTPGYEKLIKVMEIIRIPLAKPHGSVPLLNPAHQHRDIDMSSMKILTDLIFFSFHFV